MDKLDDSKTPVCIVLPDILVACPNVAPPAIACTITPLLPDGVFTATPGLKYLSF